jgi:hypothetical protein
MNQLVMQYTEQWMGAKICNDPTLGEWIIAFFQNLPSVKNQTEGSHIDGHETKTSIIIIRGGLKKQK